MKKTFLVFLIIAIAAIGTVSAAVSTLPAGEQGYYDITSSPSGAAVMVDGTPSGTTPTAASVIVGASGHTIAVNKAGFEPWSQYYPSPAAGQRVAVNAVLVPIPVTLPATPLPGSQKGYYRVNSDPNGGSVVFDGTNYGLTPVTITVSTYRDSGSYDYRFKIRLPDLEPVLFREPGCRSDCQCFCNTQSGCPDW